MRFRPIFILLPVAALSGTLTSCSSIFEDRTECPCRLYVDLDKSPERPVCDLFVWNEETTALKETADARDYNDQYPFCRGVRKNIYDISAAAGCRNNYLEGRTLLLKPGTQCDSLWAYCSRNLDCTGESAYDTVRLHKQYAAVLMALKINEIEDFPYHIVLKSDAKGIDLCNVKEPILGTFGPKNSERSDGEYDAAFSLPLELPASGECRFNLQRHGRGSLNIRIELFDKNGSFYMGYNLGEEINRSGYDWTEDDLKDIRIDIDFSRQEIKNIVVTPWDHVDVNEGHEIVI